MLKEETIQQIKDMLERSQSHDVIAHCDYLIENNKDEDKLVTEVGEIGEICARGSGLAYGYYNDPERTAETFVQNPLNTAYPEVIYRTGDLGKRNERDL